ncbi:MAG: hypothetical protein V3T86_07400 [Planctomycetota bacterium]
MWGHVYALIRDGIEATRAEFEGPCVTEMMAASESALRSGEFRYSDRLKGCVSDYVASCQRAIMSAPECGLLRVHVSPEEFRQAYNAIGSELALRQHLGEEGQGSFFGSKCGVAVDKSVKRALDTLAQRGDDLAKNAAAVSVRLVGHIQRTNKTGAHVSASDRRADPDDMQLAIIAAGGSSPLAGTNVRPIGKRTLRRALLSPKINRQGGEFDERENNVRSYPQHDSAGSMWIGSFSDTEQREWRVDGADSSDEETETGAAKIGGDSMSPEDCAVLGTFGAELEAIKLRLRQDRAAAAELSYALDEPGCETREHAAQMYGVGTEAMRASWRRVLAAMPDDFRSAFSDDPRLVRRRQAT